MALAADPQVSDAPGPLIPRRVTATEAAADAVRALILSYDLEVGAPLRQHELARRLGVSRTPLREALNRLATEGLVRLDPHHGAVVASPSRGELVEIYETRMLLEVHAGRLAARRVVPGDVDELEDLVERHERAVDAATAARANADFHHRLYAIAGQRVLAETITALRNRSEAFVRLLFGVPQRAAQAAAEHRRMVAALVNGDEGELVTLIGAHLDATVNDVIPLIGGRHDDDPSAPGARPSEPT
ncbi:MAG TPA: GntR family transcriptional regulator [Acidimicrobiales bacterium]|nr:GntR family transcriptional regulator [Acidimicrobiales bacterium]